MLSKAKFCITRKKSIIIYIACILILASGIALSQQGNSKIRIGTFDSRSITFAYSSEFMKEMYNLKVKLTKAKKENNKELVEELEQSIATKMVLISLQAFSTASILNIIEKVKDKLPDIAKKNNLKAILSKWEVIFWDESIELIDITDQLVALFDVDKKSRKIIEVLKTMDPMPIEQMSVDPKEYDWTN